MSLQHCPACDGNGGHYNQTHAGELFLRCGLCAASGQVTQEQIAQYQKMGGMSIDVAAEKVRLALTEAMEQVAAMAVAVERERCAKIADLRRNMFGGEFTTANEKLIVDHIAAAIRKVGDGP